MASFPSDQAFMRQALLLAQQAEAAGEVPVGALVVHQGQVIGRGHNSVIAHKDPTAHAEVLALRAAAATLQNYRLEDCELFVTLEPCAMCAGAMLHARVKRVVFGASDAKTGACGSVLNLFAHEQLNHQTQVLSGMLAKDCAALLQNFFQSKRVQQQARHEPLREDALRTPLLRFAPLNDYPWRPNYVSNLAGWAGLRLHYLDEGPHTADATFVCLHGTPSWSYQYRELIPILLDAGCRVLAPDLIGFGKSDKPKKEQFHSWHQHQQILLAWLTQLDLNHVVLVLDEASAALGLSLYEHASARVVGVLPWINPTLTPQAKAAMDAPFPDAGHRAALRAFAASPMSLET